MSGRSGARVQLMWRKRPAFVVSSWFRGEEFSTGSRLLGRPGCVAEASKRIQSDAGCYGRASHRNRRNYVQTRLDSVHCRDGR